MKKNGLICAAVLLVSGPTMAMDAFKIKSISIQGSQRISADTVRSYLPVKAGDVLTTDETGDVIETLYQTGFFENISLARRGKVLVVRVTERPTIGRLKISGNHAIPTERLTAVMKTLGIVEGRVYDSVVLARIHQGLLNQYYLLGRYNARVDLHVSNMSQNRIMVTIDISEGLIAKVRQINIIGNQAFDRSTVLRHFSLGEAGIVSFFTFSDRFSQDKFQAAMEKLRHFYMDRGYLRFAVKSSQVSVTPDRKSIYITLVLDEGKPYRIKDIHLIGETILPAKTLLKKMNIHAGDIFSRKAVIDAEKAITDALGAEGYIFATVTPRPVIDNHADTTTLNFDINPGRRVYVRYISFTNNARTNDRVLRRELSQMEAAPVSTELLEQSRVQLNRLPFIRDVETGLEPVAGVDDQVDVNYKIKEDGAAQANMNVSYGQVGGLGFGVGLNQKNFLGMGDTLGINLSRNRYQQTYSVDFSDPYYTPEGVSRSIGLSVVKFDPHGANLTNGYSDDQYSLYALYGIPAGQEKGVTNRIQLGYGYEESAIRLSSETNSVSQQILSFVNRYGRRFRQLNFTGGYSRDSRDRSIFPTSGSFQTVGANVYLPVDGQSLKYFLMSYRGKWFFPLTHDFIATARGEIGYGSSFDQGANGYPFFKNFYAGGIGSVPGFEGNTLGPGDSTGHPSGGNELITGGIGLIVPNPMKDKLRTEFFLDGGNVYNTWNNRKYGGTPSGPPRFSIGLGVEWLSPIGGINLSFAKGLNVQPGDTTDFFQFQLGANFA